jgi:hypothetical protein
VQAAFGTVLWVVCAVGLLAAFAAILTGGRTWEEYGKSRLLLERDMRDAAKTGSVGTTVERDAEIRQLLEARNHRRARRGEAPIDVEPELRRLTAQTPQIDSELRGEIRDLVLARNHRRARLGKPPLDVEAEIEREIAGLANL